jgi:hypothetical protein
MGITNCKKYVPTALYTTSSQVHFAICKNSLMKHNINYKTAGRKFRIKERNQTKE